jgi:hypothetical protein
MKTLASANSSRIVHTLQQQTPVRRASSMDQRFIGFLQIQAVLPQRAALVVTALEEEVQKGYRLDETLMGILRKAKETMRMFPRASAAH